MPAIAYACMTAAASLQRSTHAIHPPPSTLPPLSFPTCHLHPCSYCLQVDLDPKWFGGIPGMKIHLGYNNEMRTGADCHDTTLKHTDGPYKGQNKCFMVR